MIATKDLPASGRRWGRWVEIEPALCLPHGAVAYEVPIADAVAHPRAWIDHMAAKNWVTAADVDDLVDALWEIATEGPK